MVTYEELNKQNHRITELSNVLRYLFKDRSMCDTDSCCSLFYNYVDLLKKHIEMVDREMCSELLKSRDVKISNVAKNFMSGSVEIKKILNNFSRQWCPVKAAGSLKIKDHEKFQHHTDELFDMTLRRILDETEHLYPLIRSLSTGS